MKVLRSDVSVLPCVAGQELESLYEALCCGGLSCRGHPEVAEAALPGPNRIPLRARYEGIYNSDWSWIHLCGSPHPSAPTSAPSTPSRAEPGAVIQLDPWGANSVYKAEFNLE